MLGYRLVAVAGLLIVCLLATTIHLSTGFTVEKHQRHNGESAVTPVSAQVSGFLSPQQYLQQQPVYTAALKVPMYHLQNGLLLHSIRVNATFERFGEVCSCSIIIPTITKLDIMIAESGNLIRLLLLIFSSMMHSERLHCAGRSWQVILFEARTGDECFERRRGTRWWHQANLRQRSCSRSSTQPSSAIISGRATWWTGRSAWPSSRCCFNTVSWIIALHLLTHQ